MRVKYCVERQGQGAKPINTRALHGTLFLFGTDGYGFQEQRV